MSSFRFVVPAGTGDASSASEPIFQPRVAKVRLFVLIIGILGTLVVAHSIAAWESTDLLKYAGFLLMAVFCSSMRISVPGMAGTLGLNFIFIPFGLGDLGTGATI